MLELYFDTYGNINKNIIYIDDNKIIKFNPLIRFNESLKMIKF